MLRHFRLTTLVALFVVIPAVAAAAAPFAYVTNSGSASILVIDTATNTAATPLSMPVGRIPWGVALSPDGSRVYVTHFMMTTGSLLAFNAGTGALIREVSLGNFPFGVAVHPTTGDVYVSMAANGFVKVVKAATFTDPTLPATFGTPITVGSPRGVALDPTGRLLFVTSNFSARLFAFNTAAPSSPAGEVIVGGDPVGVAVSPDGSRVYVANETSNTVSVVNVLGDGTLTLKDHVAVGTGPIGVTVTPDGARVYVTNSVSDTVSVLDAGGNRLPGVPDVYVGDLPYGISTNGSYVYVAVQKSNKVVVLDLNLNKIGEIPASSPIAFGQFVLPQLKVKTAMTLGLSAEATVLGSTAPMTATATLLRQDNGGPVAGASVSFMLDGTTVGSALTDAGGAAQLSFDSSALPVGTHTVQASFAESRINGLTYEASAAGSEFKVVYQFTWRTSGGTATAGSTIPVRWSMTDANGNAIDDASAITSITSAEGCVNTTSLGAGPAGVKARFAGSSDLRYDSASNQFLFNWKTEKEWAGQCRQFVVQLKDGTSHSLPFQFR